MDERRPPFNPSARWIWTPESRRNHYALFVRDVPVPAAAGTMRIRITASYHYELFVDGRFVHRGPVHGDPKWCHYDDLEVPCVGPSVHLAVVVHHSSGTYLHYLTPAPGGLRAEVRAGHTVVGTDESWRCLTLEMWRQDVPEKGWALGYCEDYDAALEPEGWATKTFPQAESWTQARLVEDAEAVWGGYTERGIPLMTRREAEPARFRAWSAPAEGPPGVFEISARHDEEPLEPLGGWEPYSAPAVTDRLPRATAFTFDLTRERVGFYAFELDAPEGLVVEVSGAELQQGDRPWVFRKGTCYSMRYRCRGGRQRFTSFSWSGIRYIHLVLRGPRRGEAKLRFGGCIERSTNLELRRRPALGDPLLERIFDVCSYTLQVGAQELLIDCPTREQAAAWADSLFIAESIWEAFGEEGYLRWYLEAFLRAPLNDHGLLDGRYPGTKGIWLDFCLLPPLSQAFYRSKTGAYYKPEQTLRRGLEIDRWFEERLDEHGLVSFDFREYYERGLRTFIDHPGLGMHDAPHPGIDRDGTSCGLNAFYYGYLTELASIAREAGHRGEARRLQRRAAGIAAAILELFHDGEAFHDARRDGELSAGTSWQTNALVVFFDIARGPTARRAMERMVCGYDTLCRCTPYTYFYFLTALRKVGMEAQALELIRRDWGAMLDRGATTTWEGFLGNAKDSLCHPFSTAPLLFLLEAPPGHPAPDIPS